MGIVTLAALAAIGFQLGGSIGLVSTAAALAVGSKLREIASTYINVDTPMCMFTTLCLLSLVSAPRRHSTSRWTAALCGAAMACKYNALVLLVPCLTAIALDGQPRRLVRGVGFVGMASLAFLVKAAAHSGEYEADRAVVGDDVVRDHQQMRPARLDLEAAVTEHAVVMGDPGEAVDEAP
jgi:hypothetical protein